MSKNKVSEWSSTPSNNTDVGGIDIAEGCAPSGINNAIREMMAQIKDMEAGTDGDSFTVGGNLSVTGTTTLGTALPVASGGTGSTTESGARTSLGLGTIATQAASSVSITGGSITGITDIAVADGGTGASTLTANAVLIGNGTSAITSVSPSTSGNVLTSNGTAWTSATPATQPSLGVGQTWQDVTSSRVVSTTYTNSTGKPIMVTISVTSTTNGPFNSIISVDEYIISSTFWPNGTLIKFSLSFINFKILDVNSLELIITNNLSFSNLYL
jgi:hypothetical protein